MASDAIGLLRSTAKLLVCRGAGVSPCGESKLCGRGGNGGDDNNASVSSVRHSISMLASASWMSSDRITLVSLPSKDATRSLVGDKMGDVIRVSSLTTRSRDAVDRIDIYEVQSRR
jgi:hypothetical protein